MPSFINFNNKQELTSNVYTKKQISEALYVTESKDSRKIEALVEGLDRTTPLNEALNLFKNKLDGMSALSVAKNHYSGTLYEGQFSWMTQDSGQQIGSEKQNTIDVWMYDNKGNSWYEKRYDGYGEFGGMDYYELLARMNGYTEEDLEDKAVLKSIRVMGKGSMRDIGIALAFGEGKLKTRDKGGDVLFPALVADGRYNWKRHDFKQEAESDPNQSWFQEEEYDDDYGDDYDEEYYESASMSVNEWGSSDQSIFLDAMHKDAGKPKKMPSPFDSKLRAAAEDAVDFYWEDWPEYKSDREGLVDDAVRSYLRRYFKKDFEMMQRMFEPMESLKIEEAQIRVHSWFGQKQEFRDWLKKHKVEVVSAEGEDGKDTIELTLTGKTKDLKKILVSDHKFGWDDKQMWAYIEESKSFDELYESALLENAVRDLHFETDPKKAEELKIEIGASQGEVTRKKQIEGGEYSLKRFRKEIKYDTTGEDLGIFKPGSYMAATSTLGDGPHKKAVKKIKWNLKKYNQWLEDVASNGGWENAYDMAQNAKHEPGLLDWAKKEFRGEDVMQRIQWDIEAFAESTDTKKLTWDSLKEALGINEAKKMSIGDQGVDYNDNIVEIVAIGNFKKIAKMFKKEMKADAADWGYEEGAGDFYLTKNIEATEGNVGDLAIYPVKYDMANYWGLDPLKESKVNEGRSINKISKEHSAVVLDMSNTVKEWKEAEGDRKSDLLEKLRGLNKRKAELEKELDQAVAGKDSEVELALSESEVNEKDDAGTHLDNLADLVGNAKSFMNVGKELKAGNYKYDFSTGMMPMYMIHADGFKFAILNKKYVDGGDREVGDIAIGLMEAVDLKKKVEALNEGLRNDLKKFIKKNQKELDRLADLEEWERLYLMLYTEFDVEPESDEAKEVKDAFDLTY
jgi:hypothetical protein